MRVGIIGLGVIGIAQGVLFADHEQVRYDSATDDEYPARELAECDFALICVGTPASSDGRADLTYVATAVKALPEGLPVAVRSTVPPGTTDGLLKGTGRLYCHAPEFMGENVLHSWQRSGDVPYMIFGGDPEATLFFKTQFAQVFPGHIHECSAIESELAKYAANLYWATRVTFVNELALICKTFGVDYENVRAAWLSDPRMTSVYTKRAGYPPGFDGRCWPKDLAALIAASSDAGYEPGFLRAIQDANARFRVGFLDGNDGPGGVAEWSKARPDGRLAGSNPAPTGSKPSGGSACRTPDQGTRGPFARALGDIPACPQMLRPSPMQGETKPRV